MELERLLRTQDAEMLRSKVQSLISRYRGTAFALYVDALTETEAKRAVEKYDELVDKFPNSRYASEALIKVGQYYFSRGLYISARRKFLEFIDNYPKSIYIHDARYFALASLCATKKDEACYAELKKFLIENSRSPFARLAKEDLNALRQMTKADAESNVLTTNTQGEYTVQIGAFSQVNRALNLKNYCLKLGLPVEIREKNRGNKTMYLVWVGSFTTESAAMIFGKRFKEEHGKPFRIVAK